MSEEPWDPEKVAAECAATARAKRGPGRPRKGEPPRIPITGTKKPEDPGMRDPETGTFIPGHPGITSPGSGAPSKYDPEILPRVAKWARMGATVAELSDWLDIAQSTFHKWRHDHEAFAEAVKTGRLEADDRMQRSMFERGIGYTTTEEQAVKIKVGKDEERVEIVEVQKHIPGDVGAQQFWMTNRRGDEWKHRRTFEHSGSIEHVSVDKAKQELLEFFASQPVDGGDLVGLPAPSAEPDSAAAE